VDVLCDETGRVGALSYLVPAHLEALSEGDAVTVPFGTRELHGLVLGPGDRTKATREVKAVLGPRAAKAELDLARELARRHFSELSVVASRLSPRSGRGAEPLDSGPVTLLSTSADLPEVDPGLTRRFYVTAPLVDAAEVAALEAARLSAKGQVLVLCPTLGHLERVMALFSSGAARLDTKAPKGAWAGFLEGKVRIGVGTRSAALYSAKALAAVVVLDEDHPGHLEATQPYTHARDVAALRTLRQGLDLALVGSNPTPSGVGARLKVMAVGTRADWPTVRLVNRNDFPPSERLLPPPLRAALDRSLRSQRPVLVLAEKRAAQRRCSRCGELRPCPECKDSNCRHAPKVPCSRCGSDKVKMVGWDAPRLEALFGPGVKALTVAELNEVAPDDALVVVFDLDSALNAPTFQPEATASHLVLIAARAAGKGGHVVVMTREPDHPLVLDLVVRKDQLAVARRSWEEARRAALPPFGRLVTVRVGHAKEPSVEGWPGRIHGPRRTNEGWEVLVRLDDADLPKLERSLARLRRGGKVRVVVS
jgi:primosomal protein N'